MLEAIRRAIRRTIRNSASERVLEKSRQAGMTPVDAYDWAVQAECGKPRLPGERVREYTARVAGISIELLDSYTAIMQAGGQPLPGMRGLHLYMTRIGRRMSANAGSENQSGANA